MLIADEVHRLGSKHFSKIFEIKSGSRLGLSATPERFGDPEGTDRILGYFGKVLPTEFSIQDAIIKHIIKKYKIDLKLNFRSKIKNKCLKGNNSLAKKIIKWKPKKNTFLAADEIYKSI